VELALRSARNLAILRVGWVTLMGAFSVMSPLYPKNLFICYISNKIFPKGQYENTKGESSNRSIGFGALDSIE
jgi:hypothetical protein